MGIGIVEGMNVPTDHAIVRPVDANPGLDEGKRHLTGLGIKEYVYKQVGAKVGADFNEDVILDGHAVRLDSRGRLAHAGDASGKRDCV